VNRLKLGFYVVVAAVLIVAGFWGWTRFRAHESSIPVPVPAMEAHDAATESKGQGEVYAQIAQDRAPELQAAKTKVAALESELAAIRGSVMAGSSTPLPSDKLDQVIGKQDGVIHAQDTRADILEAQLGTVTAEAKAKGDSATAYQNEADALRKSIKPRYTRSLGGIWNPANSTYGVWAEQDIWRVRVGADVFQQRLSADAGGRTTWAAHVRVGWTF
jgi:hypothetical protein